MKSQRFPAVYIPHGGGPWPFVETGFGPKAAWEPLETYLKQLTSSLHDRPEAILVVSAHWEEVDLQLMTAAKPPMLYDYGGFPREAYELIWDAPGPSEKLVSRVRSLLDQEGFATSTNPTRGFDHGTFVPLKLALPGADIPILQISLVRGLDPVTHLTIGEALAPLRDEGVFLMGSGMSYHNMRGFFRPDSQEKSRAFDRFLETAATSAPNERTELLTRWIDAPYARECHPREEHLLPLHVMAGAARDDPGFVAHRSEILGVTVSAIQFGAP